MKTNCKLITATRNEDENDGHITKSKKKNAKKGN